MGKTPETDSATKAEWGWEAHRGAQLRQALRMTPAERLRWLETANEELRRLVGRARTASKSTP